ncbi:hypothetical protein [Solitalea canadensis]|uniref:Uncharacterized protein n=1 Tax=Solitalea canadensis (strain ATCC 29591 / DSM 3403 / JCM 21819 / LMG 8368 / NBRC 15130 / NCIMB 12057 / USAM 9D) TaxID=929556 RepID=H8KV01_SOLCM|nr:hypothetical protein [Solitalea canadensis]AFD07701.1 hypothetical protein Solca_2667 [Solitalea canadensis DSM 3403]
MHKDITTLFVDFLKEIGIGVSFKSITEPTIVPGVTIQKGSVVIDQEQLLYPGDILHEAGHIAVMPPEIRPTLDGTLNDCDLHRGGELMAIAWSYAACIHLKIDPHIVFHEFGYKDSGANLVDNFQKKQFVGVSTLQWCGMTNDPTSNKDLSLPMFPIMKSWLRP